MVHLLFLYDNGEAWRLAHIDFFLEVDVERKADFDIHMVATPSFLSCKRKEDLDRLHAHNRSEGVVVVDPLLLDETARNQPSLVLDHCS